jgi:hypothetical protein
MKESPKTLLLFTIILLVSTITCNPVSAQPFEQTTLEFIHFPPGDGFFYHPVSDFQIKPVQELPNFWNDLESKLL